MLPFILSKVGICLLILVAVMQIAAYFWIKKSLTWSINMLSLLLSSLIFFSIALITYWLVSHLQEVFQPTPQTSFSVHHKRG